jgi:hypothetical protein
MGIMLRQAEHDKYARSFVRHDNNFELLRPGITSILGHPELVEG